MFLDDHLQYKEVILLDSDRSRSSEAFHQYQGCATVILSWSLTKPVMSFSAGFSKIFGENLPAEREVQKKGPRWRLYKL